MNQVSMLFQREKSRWLDEARATARKLLMERPYITINDVLELAPRPDYLHRNTTGKVFDHKDFKTCGFEKSKAKAAKGRIICQWTLKEGLPTNKNFYWQRKREAQ